MTYKQQPEALRLADWLRAAVQIFPQRSEDDPGGYASEVDQIMDEAAAELRRLHAENEALAEAGRISALKEVENYRAYCAELEVLRAGYAAARLEIESLRTRSAAPDISGYVSEWAGGLCTSDEAMDGIAKLYAAQPAGAQQPGTAYAVLERLEHANDALCKLRADEQYLSMIDGGQQEALAELDAARNAARAILRAPHGQAPAQPDNSAVHLSHCNMGEHVGSCKYGDDDCPALRKAPAQAAPAAVAGPHVTDAMALAFHSALSDGAIGSDEVEEIKVGLRAALAAAPTTQPAPHPVDEFQPCPSCFGTGVEGDADDYGRTIDVTCGECNGSGRAKATTQPSPASQGDALDAVRYRWLREQPFDTWKRIAWNTWDNDPVVWPDRDAAIDAARAAQKGGA